MRRPVNANRTTKPTEKHLINEMITAPNIRLIGVDGEQIGIVTREDALERADDAGVDLVMVAEEADPPVCRLLDYGKLKYKEQKKASEARKKSATNAVKELRVRYSTDDHDLNVKIRNARKFLESGDKVRFQMRFRGREVVYESLGTEIFKRIAEELSDIASVEEQTPLMGRKMMLGLAPKGSAKK